MDAQRFDDLARLLAQPTTRRTVWRGAIAAAAGWLAHRTVDHAGAQDGCVVVGEPCDDTTTCCGGEGVGCCDGVCTDIHTVTNCGSCGNTCAEGDRCCHGVCSPPLDPNNCGSCGNRCDACEVCAEFEGYLGPYQSCVAICPPEQGCVDGVCVDNCPARTVPCGGRCVDLVTDPSNCGACGNSCGPSGYGSTQGLVCIHGECQCPPGQIACQGDDEEFASCTSACTCCVDCRFGCEDGKCACPDGLTQCGCQDDDCVDLATDPTNCGACEAACGPDESCVAGTCQVASGGVEPLPSPVAIPTAGPVTLPSTGTGARGGPSGRDNVPLVGAVVAVSAAAAAWIRTKVRASQTSDE